MRKRHVDTIFYTGFPAYNFVPTDAQVRKLRESGYTVAVFTSNDLPQTVTGKSVDRLLTEKIEGEE